jgi:hypothetical protein
MEVPSGYNYTLQTNPFFISNQMYIFNLLYINEPPTLASPFSSCNINNALPHVRNFIIHPHGLIIMHEDRKETEEMWRKGQNREECRLFNRSQSY